ncbi:hypothetical protein [Robertmurraya sp. Marseille-Q9965]
MQEPNIPIRRWLSENNYSDVTDLIDEIMDGWKKEGKKTRRNWWDVLAGGKNGTPKTIEGITFPVLKAAQLRQGVAISNNALCRNAEESIPDIWKNGRWPSISEELAEGN